MKKLFFFLCLLMLEATVFCSSLETSTSIPMELSCQTCTGTYAPKQCGACKLVYYCSAQCQKADWQTHKVACKKSRPQVPLLVVECRDWMPISSDLSNLFERALQFGSSAPTAQELTALNQLPTTTAVPASPDFEDALQGAESGIDNLD